MRLAIALSCLLAVAARAEPKNDPIVVEAQTWTVAPVKDSTWMLGGSARASVGLLGLAVSGYQQSLTGPVGTPARLGSLLASMTVSLRVHQKIRFGAALGANTLFVEPDVTSIAPSLGFFARFDLLPWLSAELETNIAPFPHFRADALSEVSLRWKALSLSVGYRVVTLDAVQRLVGRRDVTTMGVHVGIGIEWSG